jgi:glycosyltransferase involved in cell wall biosynthesis
MPKQRVKAQVVTLGPGVIPSAVVRQQGVPVHDLAFSRRTFSMRAFTELLNIAREFRPDIIQAWGHTAQLAALATRARCDKNIRVVWIAANTAPLPRNAGIIDRQKLKLAARYSRKADRLVFTSESGASQHERAGYSDHSRTVIPAGVDATRFKSDPEARAKVRERLELPEDAYVIGMVAPFQVESDHATLVKAVGELIKTHPNIHLVLAGHGVNKGNAPLMALLGGGTLATHVHLLGEWSDVASLFNACDLVCSSAVTDAARMTLVMAMLCDVPCVATGMGAQGEVIGQFGVAVEPGNPAAFVRGITRVLQLPEDRLAYMIKGARKHALKNFVQVSSLQKYLQLYHELIGRESLATNEADEAVVKPADLPEAPSVKPAPEASSVKPALEVSTAPAPAAAAPSSPEPDPAASVTAAASAPAGPPSAPAPAKAAPLAQKPIPSLASRPKQKIKEKMVSMTELADPDSLELKVGNDPVREKPLADADVLVLFESEIAQNPITTRKDAERARGVADEMEDLLAPEELQAAFDAPSEKVASSAAAKSNEVIPAAQPVAADASGAVAADKDADAAAIQLQLIPDEPEPKKAAGQS